MRIIVYGAGAVGSVIGGRLHQAGADVVLVARPAHVEAITATGLQLRTADRTDRINVRAVSAVRELTPTANDVIIITAKTQDVAQIHDDIDAWNPAAAVVCGTNGVEHERIALRRFERVYGMVIQLPATFESPGEVTALCGPTNALIDLGRFPNGIDSTASEFAAIASASPEISCVADPAIMAKKYTKILVNLGNAAEGACGLAGRAHPVSKAAQDEAKAIYAVAGIPGGPDPASTDGVGAVDDYAARAARMEFRIPGGQVFLGGSTWQGLAKGSQSVETDYFNGEICLLGRLHGVPTPHNQFLQQLARNLARSKAGPASMTPDELTARWQAETSLGGSSSASDSVQDGQ
jgi:2-dehydropantoate 2-reductase